MEDMSWGERSEGGEAWPPIYLPRARLPYLHSEGQVPILFLALSAHTVAGDATDPRVGRF